MTSMTRAQLRQVLKHSSEPQEIDAAAIVAEGGRGGQSELEARFKAALKLHGADLPEPLHDTLQPVPGRKHRADFAWLPDLIVEIDGGQHQARGGRHNTDADRVKLNEAAAAGWRILRFSGDMLERDPVGCIDVVRRALRRTE